MLNYYYIPFGFFYTTVMNILTYSNTFLEAYLINKFYENMFKF
jgi:hypothetical protein